jgi:hypothetical protein
MVTFRVDKGFDLLGGPFIIALHGENRSIRKDLDLWL